MLLDTDATSAGSRMKRTLLFILLSSVLASAADWDTLESTSKMDGTKRTTVIKQSTDHNAALIVRLNGSALDVYMTFDGRFEYTEGHQHVVRIKLDGRYLC
jgi:hypothetical protein